MLGDVNVVRAVVAKERGMVVDESHAQRKSDRKPDHVSHHRTRASVPQVYADGSRWSISGHPRRCRFGKVDDYVTTRQAGFIGSFAGLLRMRKSIRDFLSAQQQGGTPSRWSNRGRCRRKCSPRSALRR